ncbi:MAG TPA: hypothetical protein VHD35_14595 [Chitinophagaceae bacterium]|nr:hypothetical protein [Chitinophagaceae bacterium]HVZ96332.1 hypothetical protein [Chitinophagaceae bacterium]
MKWLVPVALIFLAAACKDSNKIPENFDYGKVENGIYKNNFFGFELPIPADWIVQNSEQIKQISEEGQKIMSEHNPELGEKIKASDVRSATLLSVFRYKDDSVVGQYNPSFGIAVENLGSNSLIKTPEAYLNQVKTLMQGSGIPYKFLTGFVPLKIGNKDFTVMELTAVYKGNAVVGQMYYCTIDKGFAISVVTSFGTDEQREQLRHIISDLRFN